MELGELTFETAKPLAGTTFEVTLPDGHMTTLKLDDVLSYVRQQPRRVRGGRPNARMPFALYFLGPPSEILPQGTYAFRSERVTWNALFIVPIGRDEEATEYEAVFT
jgi:hypothetical protein